MDRVKINTIAKILVILVILSLIPLSTTKLPQTQAQIKGLDPELIDVNGPRGTAIDNDTITLTANPSIVPFATTLTTSASFVITFNGTVQREQGFAMPLQAGVWDPLSQDTFSVWFTSPDNTINYGTRKSSDTWETMAEIGTYAINSSYTVQISFFVNSYVELSVSNSTWSNTKRLDRAAILSHPIVSFSFYANAVEAESVSVISQYSVTIPAQEYFTYFTDFLGPWLDALYIALIAAIVVLWRRDLLRAFRQIKSGLSRTTRFYASPGKEKWIIAVTIVAAFLIQAYISTMGSHPYDVFSQKTWSYITNQYGLGSLYPMSLILPSGRSIGSVSIISLSYSYPPLLGYVYLLVGFVNWILVPKIDLFSPAFDFLVKLPWIAATILLGVVVYFYMKKVTGRNFAFILAALILFNPGIIVDSAIWGQSEAILALFLCLALLALIQGSPKKMWFFLALSILSKQTAIVAAVFILIIATQRFGFTKIVKSLAFPFVLMFLALSPWLIIGYSPSFFFNVSLGENVLNAIGNSRGIATWQMPVSGGAHNLWVILTSKLNLQSGWSRFVFSDSLPNQIFGESYSSFGFYLTLAFLVFILLQTILYQKKNKGLVDHNLFFLLYIVVLTTTLLMTRMSPRYLFPAIPFLILAYPWIRSKISFGLLFGSLSLSFFLSIYSNLVQTSFLQQPILPNFYPTANPFNQIMFRFTSDDYWISALSLFSLALFGLSIAFSTYKTFSSKRDSAHDISRTVTPPKGDR